MVVSTLAPRPNDPYRIFPAAQNWSSNYRHTYEFLTDVITTGSGKEQRRAVREYPRVKIEGEAMYSGEQKTLLDFFFHAWQPYPAIAGLEDRAVKTSGFMAPEAIGVELWLDGPVNWLRSGLVIIRHAFRPGVMETRMLLGVGNDGRAVFADYSKTEFPPGSWVMPAVHGWAGSDPTGSRRTNAVGTYSYSFVCDPLHPHPFVDFGEAKFLAGKEVFEKKPNYRDRIDVNYQWERTPIDYSYGAIGNPVNIKFPTRTMKANYLGRDRNEIAEVVNFWRRQQGRRQDFFTLSYEDDIPYDAISGGGRAILIKGTAFAYTYMGSTVFRRIALRLIDGSLSYHLVDYIEALPSGDSVLWVTDQLPVAELTRNTVRGISWAPNSRFATDALTVNYRSNSVGEFSLAIQTLENFEL